VDGTWPRIIVQTRQEGRVNAPGIPLSPEVSIASIAAHSRKKVVWFFLGWIPSRKNPKKWRYLSGKMGRFFQKAHSDAC
jgi:hypothetical protein